LDVNDDPGERFGAFQRGDRVYMCKEMRLRAAVADYYFWWANRLFSYYAHESGDLWDNFIGSCCARSAMAEVNQIADIIIHEWIHWAANALTGSGSHCKGTACSMYVIPKFFRERVAADLCLPEPLIVGDPAQSTTRWSHGLNIPYAGVRHFPDIPENIAHDGGWIRDPEPYWESIDPHYSCGAGSVDWKHCNMWAPGHQVRISWELVEDCADWVKLEKLTNLKLSGYHVFNKGIGCPDWLYYRSCSTDCGPYTLNTDEPLVLDHIEQDIGDGVKMAEYLVRPDSGERSG